VRESANALVAITSIDPLTKPELINRTLDVEFRSLFQSGGFMQREHLERLIRARGRILSGLFNLFAREVLPGLPSARKPSTARGTTIVKRIDKYFASVDPRLSANPLILLVEVGGLEPPAPCLQSRNPTRRKPSKAVQIIPTNFMIT
jgi:hypothetical protein